LPCRVEIFTKIISSLAKKGGLAGAAARKEEQIEKKHELEKRLQDVAGVLGNAKKAKKG